ncbi:prepilin-type N-terminal cleavage/methylation domain-containing protein [Psychromonas sp.]|nr:prepilin-type N-terminal cleavage/methylation domain-containing protein [Psychromonas sp.]
MNSLFSCKSYRQFQGGFTLIELVIGIVVLAVALLAMSTMLISQSKDALEPIHRMRASQIGQNILQNILSRAYDQNSDHAGGLYRCGEVWGDSNLWYDSANNIWTSSGTPTAVNCTIEANYGIDVADGEVTGEHQNFNDVDDFIESSFISAVTYGNVLGEESPSQLQNYLIKIDVVPYGVSLKEISVTVKTPTDEDIIFSALKGNY